MQFSNTRCNQNGSFHISMIFQSITNIVLGERVWMSSFLSVTAHFSKSTL